MTSTSVFLLTAAALRLVAAQHPGDDPEVHPKLTTWRCTNSGGCVAQDTAVVLDSLAHPVYQVDAPDYNCGDWGSPPNATACPDAETCQANCVMQGVSDYSEYGIVTDGGSLYMDMLRDDLSVISPRAYLLTEDGDKYEMLQLTGQEISFDVDVSKLPCGMNGAFYLSEMEEDGGESSLNTGGASYGTGYCDAQCYTTPFINGEPNIEGYGACCNEMDIWEANAKATSSAPHTCNITSLYECEGDECGSNGVCDKNGCSYNTYRLGAPDFYGPNLTVDTTRVFTVVTQFPVDSSGALESIRRLYVQDGIVIQNADVDVDGLPAINYTDDELCEDTGADKYIALGGTAGMGEALARGMVLCFAVWWDDSGFMNWLDAGEAGPCSDTEGDPDVIEQVEPDTAVTFSNIKWGEIGSTYEGVSKYMSSRQH